VRDFLIGVQDSKTASAEDCNDDCDGTALADISDETWGILVVAMHSCCPKWDEKMMSMKPCQVFSCPNIKP
jgi:hypothetical protein